MTLNKPPSVFHGAITTPELHSLTATQIRFLKYVYKTVDDRKVERMHKRQMAELAEGRRKNPDRTRALSRNVGQREAIPSSSAHQATTGRGGTVNAGMASLSGSAGGIHSPATGQNKGRRRLLEQKRGILLQLKGLVSRQAEALDQLAEGCDDTTKNHNTSSSSVYSGRTGRGCRSSGSVRDRAAARYRDRIDWASGSRGTSTMSSSAPPSSYRPTQSGRTHCSSTDRYTNELLRPLPRPPEQNATSNFLALGGRWENTTVGEGVSRHRSSIASSASYASYGEWDNGRWKKDSGGMRGNGGCYRTPNGVPALPIGK